MSYRGNTTLRLIGWNLLVALAYAAIGAVTLVVARYTGLAAPLWPAAGVAFVLVYMRGIGLAPGIMLGAFAVDATALVIDGTSAAIAVAVGAAVGVGAGLQATVGAALVRRYLGTHLSLSRGGQVLAFLLFAGPLACVINPTIGVLAQLGAGVMLPADAPLGWLTWWVGDSAGVVVFAPLALMFFPEQADIWRHRHWKVALPSLIAVVLLGGAFLQSAALERNQVTAEREAVAEAAVRDVQESLAQNAEVLNGVKAFMESDEHVTREEFATFTKDALRRFPNLHALSWNPVVTDADLPAFIDHQVSVEGMTDFQVTERGPDGNLRPVTPQDDYVVVSYIEPLKENLPAVGYDIKSNPVRAAAIERAILTGAPAATAPIDLVQESGDQKGALLLLPVYAGGVVPPNDTLRRTNIEGFTVGVYRLDDLLVTAFDNAEWRDVTLRMFDVTDAEPVLLAEQLGSTRPIAENTAIKTFDVGGRTWQLDVTPVPEQLGNPAAAPAYLLAGLLIVTLLEAFLLLVTGMERQARRQADASHFDANHDGLTELLNRRAFMKRVSEARLRAEQDEATHVLMYLDLDRFKAVNDRGGHVAGDRCLREIAQRFAQCVRGGDTVARLGGDEFAVLLGECPIDRGLGIARELVGAVETYRPFPTDPSLVIGVSVGLTTIDSTSPGVNELLHRADIACYEAKRDDKSHIRVYGASTATQST